MSPEAVSFRKPVTVPKQFSIGAFLGITTVWSLMVVGLQALSAPLVTYFFFGIQLFLVCLAQMRFEKSPRWASFLAGAAVMYAVVLAAQWLPTEFRRLPTRLFIASQFVGFWGGGNGLVFLVYRQAGLGVDDVWFSHGMDELIALLLSFVVGGVYGYMLGTFTAGIFLLGNRLSSWIELRGPYSDSQPQAS